MINESGQLIIVWNTDDVIELASQTGRKRPTLEQAMDVLHMADSLN